MYDAVVAAAAGNAPRGQTATDVNDDANAMGLSRRRVGTSDSRDPEEPGEVVSRIVSPPGG